MKKILIISLIFSSLNAFSQSYLILNNGVTLTTDNKGFLYDFGHFHLPYKVNLNGGRFFVEDNNLLTVDSSGFLYNKLFKVGKVKVKGTHFIINEENELITIDSNGFYYVFDKDGKTFKKVIAYGGNFFVVKPDDKKQLLDIYAVNDKGNYFKVSVEGLNLADIIFLGGSFFQTKNGVIHTVSKDGFIFSKKDIKVGSIVKSGGNYFIDSDNTLFTVSEDGPLNMPVIPVNLKINKIIKTGSNYMIDSEGRIFTVDHSGQVLERTSVHDLSSVKIISF